MTSKLYLGPGYATVPGMTNVYGSPFNLYDSSIALITAYKIGDKDGVVENSLRVFQSPIGFVNATMSIAYNIIHAGLYLKIFDHPYLPIVLTAIGPLAKAIAVTGMALCSFEVVLEIFGLIRSNSFFDKVYPSDFESLKNLIQANEPSIIKANFLHNLKNVLKQPISGALQARINYLSENENLPEQEYTEAAKEIFEAIQTNIHLSRLEKIQQKYFQISDKKMGIITDYVRNQLPHLSESEQNERKEKIIGAQLERKKNKLTRQVHPWLYERIESELPTLMADLQNPSLAKKREANAKAESIFANIKTQWEKKQLIHTIGLCAVLVTIAGLIAGCVSCPLLVPVVLLFVGGGLSIARGLLHLGTMDEEGWNFSAWACVPESLKELYTWITQLEKKQIIDALGICAVVVAITGLIAGCVVCPILSPAFLVFAMCGLYITLGLLHLGRMDEQGWKLSAWDCIPETLKKFYIQMTTVESPPLGNNNVNSAKVNEFALVRLNLIDPQMELKLPGVTESAPLHLYLPPIPLPTFKLELSGGFKFPSDLTLKLAR